MTQQINLFNPIFLKQKKQFSAVALTQGLGLIFVGSILVGFYARYQYSNLGAQEAASALQLKATTAELTSAMTNFQPRQKNKALEDEIPKAEEAVRSQQQVFDIVKRGGFGNTSGYSDYLRAFARQIANGVWLTSFRLDAGGNEIELRGRALQPELVPAYINRLKKEPVMQGKSFATFTMNAPDAANAENEGNTGRSTSSGNAGSATAAYLTQTVGPAAAGDSNPGSTPSSAAGSAPSSVTGSASGSTAGVAPARPQPASYVEFTLRTAGFNKAEGANPAPAGLLPSLPMQIPGIPKDISELLGGARK